jgi:small subunit ribosomal protein S3Ae
MQMIDEPTNAKEGKKEAAPRTRKRKGVDKWKTKKWFTILAPATFNNAIIAHTPGEEAEGLMGRTVHVSARDLTGNIKKNQLMLAFKVNNVQGLNAYTRFDAVEVQPSALRRLVRRRSTKVESVDDVTCKDGTRARVKSVALSANKISRPQQAAVRRILRAEAAEVAAGSDFEALLNACATSEPIAKAIDKARKIAPMKRVDVLKVTRLTTA